MNSRSTPLTPVLKQAATIGEAWLASGWSGCSAVDPDGERVGLAGDCTTPANASAPLRGRLRRWCLDLHGDGAPADRLPADAQLLSALADRTSELEQTTDALIDANDQLIAIYDLTGSSAKSTEDRNLIADLTDDACRLTRSVAALVALENGEHAASGPDNIIGAIRDTLDGPIDQLHRAEGSAGFDIVSRPLFGDCRGRIVLASWPGSRFTTADLRRIDAVTNFLSGLISLELLHRAALASAVIERDATTAAELARMILPVRRPDMPGVEIAARCDPARLAAGDFYTWAETPDGVVFAVGDVSGKGLAAALVMTMVTRATVRAALSSPNADPTGLFSVLASELTGYLSEASVFVTMIVGIYRPGENVIRIANAGHSPVLVRTGGRTTPLPATAPPLGVLAELVPETVELGFSPGDTIMIGTDGLAEQEDEHGDQMGYDVLSEIVDEHAESGADALVAALFEAVERITADGRQDDDRTALVIHRTEVATDTGDMEEAA